MFLISLFLTTPLPQLLTYVVIYVVLQLSGAWKNMAPWMKRWLLAIACILAVIECNFLTSHLGELGNSGVGILAFNQLIWNFVILLTLVIAELFIQILKLGRRKTQVMKK